MSEAHSKLAKILCVKPKLLLDLESKMEKFTGKSKVMERIVEENEVLVKRTLEELNLPESNNAEILSGIFYKRNCQQFVGNSKDGGVKTF